MQSLILVSSNSQKREAYIHDFCSKHIIHKVDLTIITPLGDSFGIQDVREFQKKAFYKPLKGKNKIIVLDNAQSLTLEAQNALLKILEEPPLGTYMILSCTTDAFFLPTIISRCKIIMLSEEREKQNDDFIHKYTSIVVSISSGSISEKLTLAEQLTKEKGKLPEWLEGITLYLREKMLIEPENIIYAHLLKNVQGAYMLLQTTNVSPREILEHCFLHYVY